MSNEKALSSENLLLQSENLGTTWAVFTDLTSPTGNQTAPDGTSNAWLLTATTGANKSPSLSQNLVSGAGTHTLVAHLKAGSASHGFVSMRVSNGNIAYAMIDFSAGTSTHGSYGSVTNPSSTVTALGSNWYRLTLTATVSSGLAIAFIGISDGSAVQSSGYATDWSSSGETLYAWGAQLSSTNSKVYDSPTTTQISREFAPTLKTAAANAPRFEYATDGQSVGTALGLLVESQATNLVTHSSAFDDGSWNKSRAVIDSNSAIAPDGTLTADYFRATSDSTNGASVYKSLAINSNATVNASIFQKKTGGDNYALFIIYSGSSGIRQWFNLATGEIESSSVYGSGFTIVNSGVEEVGNGWMRLNVTVSCTGSSVFYNCYPGVSAGGGYTCSATTTNALIWGAMLTESSAPSSYIATTSSQVSRAADSCSVDLNGILADGQDVTLYAEGEFGDPAIKNSNRFAVALQENSNSYIILYNGGSNSGSGYVRDGGTDQAYFPSGVTAGAFKSAIAAKNNSFKYAVNGTSSTEDTAGTVPKYTTLRVGGHSSSGSELDGHVKRVAVYGQSLSSTELAALTS